MPVLHFDVESRSTVNLTDVGGWRYAADPTTEILCLTYAVDDGAVETWTPGQPDSEAVCDGGAQFQVADRFPRTI